MYEWVFDDSGEFWSGYFYYLEIENEEFQEYAAQPPKAAIVRERADYSDGYFRGVAFPAEDSRVSVSGCDDERHQQTYELDIAEIDFSGGTNIGDFVPTDEFLIVTERLARKTQTSDLKGFEVQPVRILVNQSGLPDDYPLFHISPRGRSCVRPDYWLRDDVPNQCPHCGHGPIFCRKCGFRMVNCFLCGQQTLVAAFAHKGANDKRLRLAPHEGLIVDASLWDGADFMPFLVVTAKVVKQWIEWGVAPFVAHSIRVCVDGAGDKTLEELERAKGLSIRHGLPKQLARTP